MARLEAAVARPRKGKGIEKKKHSKRPALARSKDGAPSGERQSQNLLREERVFHSLLSRRVDTLRVSRTDIVL
jgi:hypothetical protein